MITQETADRLYEIFLKYPSVNTDTRLLKEGDIFVALNGPNFRGSDFLKEAFEKGAAWCISDSNPGDSGQVTVVENSLEALQAIALEHRKRLTIPFIAITGSNGKTTTKELIHVVLSRKYKTYTTEGNLNNHIGIPLTILKIKNDADLAVVEMGANHIGEIASYCKYVQPTHGLITNCGKAHLEGFGSIEGVRKGKGELYDYLSNHDGTAFILKDEEYMKDMSAAIKRKITYGTRNADYTGTALDDHGMLSVQTDEGIIKTNLVGAYNLPNVLASIAVGFTFGVSYDDIKNALESYQPSNSRSQLIQKGNARIILDAYNANPSSMELAIKNLAMVEGKKLLLIGGMKEMGQATNEEHKKIVDLINNYTWDHVALVGEEFIGLQGIHHYFPDSIEAGRWLQTINVSNSTILVKGSRGTRMERAIEFLSRETKDS